MKFHLLNGKPAEKINKIIGEHGFRNYFLEITNVPTRKRSFGVGYISIKNNFPEETWKTSTLALEQFLLHYFYKKMKKSHNWIAFQRPTSAMIQRSGIEFSKDRSRVKIRFHFRIPLKGKKINGKELAKAFEKTIPRLVDDLKKLDESAVSQIIKNRKLLEDQMEIRKFLLENDYLAFIGEGTVIDGQRTHIRNPDYIRVPNSGRIPGIIIPYGRVRLNLGVSFLESLAKAYAYYKESANPFLKSVRDLGFISPGEESFARYAGLKGVLSISETKYPREIVLESEDYDINIILSSGTLTKSGRPRKHNIPLNPLEIPVKKIPKLKLVESRIEYKGGSLNIPYNLSATLVERNQLRGIVEAINFSKKYVDGNLDLKGIVSRTMNVLGKKGISLLGLHFYTEFTTWQLSYSMYKLIQALQNLEGKK